MTFCLFITSPRFSIKVLIPDAHLSGQFQKNKNLLNTILKLLNFIAEV